MIEIVLGLYIIWRIWLFRLIMYFHMYNVTPLEVVLLLFFVIIISTLQVFYKPNPKGLTELKRLVIK